MRVSYTTSGRLDASRVGDHWLLILGGVTRHGNRKARRAASKALESGLDVVWFDGFEETHEDSSMRVPLEVADPKGHLMIVGFEHAEARTVPGRLLSGGQLLSNSMRRWIWRVFLRRVGTILRPRSCWTTIRRDMRLLGRHTPPLAIVCGDEQAITSAWYAGRIWRSVPVLTGQFEGET